MIFLLLVVTATFQPAAPTVGDPITIQFSGPVVLDPSPDYEIVSQEGSRVVIRTFEPRPFAISGKTGDVVFRNMLVPMRSVLRPDDNMEPAPLTPPRAPQYPRAPFVAIAVAAAAAVLSWIAVILLARRKVALSIVAAPVAPAERFRAAIESLRRNDRAPHRWARLADETRIYLASLDAALGTELTTTELLSRFGEDEARVEDAHDSNPSTLDSRSSTLYHVAAILHQGDLEKFSPWGAPARDFDSLASAALALIPAERVEEQAA